MASDWLDDDWGESVEAGPNPANRIRFADECAFILTHSLGFADSLQLANRRWDGAPSMLGDRVLYRRVLLEGIADTYKCSFVAASTAPHIVAAVHCRSQVESGSTYEKMPLWFANAMRCEFAHVIFVIHGKGWKREMLDWFKTQAATVDPASGKRVDVFSQDQFRDWAYGSFREAHVPAGAGSPAPTEAGSPAGKGTHGS